MNTLVKKYFDVAKLVIWGDSDDSLDNTRKPRLVFGFRDGNPRITVYTGEAVISFPSDAPNMVTLLNYLKDIAKGPSGVRLSNDSLTTVYQDNKPTKEKKVLSTLYLGKSKEGLVYLSVISENRPKLVFTFKTSPYHVFRDGEKNVMPESKISADMAIGVADLMLDILGNIFVQYSNEEYEQGIRKQTSVNTGDNSAQASGSKDPVKQEIFQDLDDIAL